MNIEIQIDGFDLRGGPKPFACPFLYCHPEGGANTCNLGPRWLECLRFDEYIFNAPPECPLRQGPVAVKALEVKG